MKFSDAKKQSLVTNLRGLTIGEINNVLDHEATGKQLSGYNSLNDYLAWCGHEGEGRSELSAWAWNLNQIKRTSKGAGIRSWVVSGRQLLLCHRHEVLCVTLTLILDSWVFCFFINC